MLTNRQQKREEKKANDALQKASDRLHKVARSLKSAQIRHTLKHYGDMLEWIKY